MLPILHALFLHIEVLLLLAVAGRSDERFFGGPRFGRSNGIAPSSSELDARNSERFFIGSRYGKRSEQERKLSIVN